MWMSGEAEKRQYTKQYYEQIDNLNMGNRKFSEDKRMLTPSEKHNEIDQSILSEVEKWKEQDFEIQKQQERSRQELNREDLLNKYEEVKESMFSFSRLKKVDPKSPGKKLERDKAEDYE